MSTFKIPNIHTNAQDSKGRYNNNCPDAGDYVHKQTGQMISVQRVVVMKHEYVLLCVRKYIKTQTAFSIPFILTVEELEEHFMELV